MQRSKTFAISFKYWFLTMIMVCAVVLVRAQEVVPNQNVVTDTGLVKANGSDSLTKVNDSLKMQSKAKSLGIKISPESPEHPVVSTAKDSAIIDMETNKFYLYGEANVKQDEMTLKSGILEFDQKNNIVSAYPIYDTLGKKISEQEFTQGSETFSYDSLRYNFKSKRALVRNARMQYGEAYINSFQVKRNPDQSIFGYRNVYTTCNLEHPHFGISAKKIKVIPNKVAASGPANLQIADLPTPLMFPFGIFPINPQQTSGFILPTYTMENNRGLGLQGLGYYYNINKHIGVSAMFDIFSAGSYAIRTNAEYNVRYRYSGAFKFDYSLTKFGDEFDLENNTRQSNFMLRWRHTVDQRAMPGATFSANVDIGSSNNNRVNGMTADVQVNNQYNSSIAYTKSWANRPFMFQASMRHNQSTQTGNVSVTLPDLSFNVSQITPFQIKNRVGKERWFEKISANYNISAQNRLEFNDSAFSLNNINRSQFVNGIKQSASIAATYNVLRFLRWNFSIPYNEYWNTRQDYRTYNYAKFADDTTTNYGFYTSRDFQVTSGVNTRIYGMMMFKKGKVAGVRHVITPTLNFSYVPGFSRTPFNYFHTYMNKYQEAEYLSLYQRTAYGGPNNALPVGSIGFSLNNNLQMKVRTNDSAGTKNITLIDGFDIRTGYNLMADSINLQDISFSGRTSILNKFNISFGGSFNPYHYEGKTKTRYYLIEKDGPIARLRNFNVSADFNLNGDAKKDKEVEKQREDNEDVQRMLRNNGINSYYDFNIPWSLMVRGSIDYSRIAQESNKDTVYITPNLMVSGSLRFTSKMMFNFTTGYDFTKKTIGATTFNLTRDLHCWQMLLNITPFGLYRNYNFTLNVKSSVLQDLKLTRRRAFQDNF